MIKIIDSEIDWIDCDLPYYHPVKQPFESFSYLTVEEKFSDQFRKAELKSFTEEELQEIKDIYSQLDDEKQRHKDNLYDKYSKFFYEWRTTTKEVVQYEKEINNAEKRWNKKQNRLIKNTVTFCGNKLNKPGTLIKLNNKKVYLIGNVIPTGCIIEGDSDFGNIKEIPGDAKVIKYCHLLDLNNIKGFSKSPCLKILNRSNTTYF